MRVERTFCFRGVGVEGLGQGEPVHTRNQTHKMVTTQLVRCLCSEEMFFCNIGYPLPPKWSILTWPLQDNRSLQSNLALFNHSCIAPSICIAHTIAILSHDSCAIYDPYPTPLVYTIHHTILAVAILCKGQILTLIHVRNKPVH